MPFPSTIHRPCLPAIDLGDEDYAGMVFEDPFETLHILARTYGDSQPMISLLIDQSESMGTFESACLAVGLAWIDGGHRSTIERLQLLVPPWLAELDHGRIVVAKRRRLDSNETQYLIEVELLSGHIGTVQARIDHNHRDVLVHSGLTDDSLPEIERVFRMDFAARTDPLRRRGRPRQTKPFRQIKPKTAVAALTAAIRQFELTNPGQEPARSSLDVCPGMARLLRFVLVHFA